MGRVGDTLESERSSLPVHKLTPEEYLAIERDAATKSEYYQGEMFAMSGASARHDDIAENVKAALRQRLKAFPCKVNSGDLRLRVSPTGLYTYPDISITCGPRRFADSKHPPPKGGGLCSD
jgi:Uma2 family endonuclease